MGCPGLVTNPQIREAFTGDPAVAASIEAWERLTTLLVGIGTFLASPLWQASGNALSSAEEGELSRAGAVGEICLRFFDIDGHPMKPAIEERVISINAEAMMQVPRRVGVAGRMGKLNAIRGAVAGGWINVLITDADVARQLLEPPP
jgi:DNA-binding transcriptional regulator LsrR (DeoR family)